MDGKILEKIKKNCLIFIIVEEAIINIYCIGINDMEEKQHQTM
jgi:hypothetical protein